MIPGVAVFACAVFAAPPAAAERAPGAPAARLQAAAVTLTLADGAARIEARYAVAGPVPAMRFVLRRLAGQELDLKAVEPPASIVTRRSQPGILALEVTPPGAAERQEIILRYEVRGALRHLPLAVPQAPADPLGDAVLVRLRGLTGERSPTGAFPHLLPAGDGVFEARLANLPSVVRPPPPAGALTVSRAADAAVILLVVLATAVWLHRQPPGRSGT
ncbi:MAG: hypothetical protein D6696_06675 [Acidobacteria bacterium]|nr:MAG: hypothetical protein D6696_06675 [Acidobacteriota bacterium]